HAPTAVCRPRPRDRSRVDATRAPRPKRSTTRAGTTGRSATRCSSTTAITTARTASSSSPNERRTALRRCSGKVGRERRQVAGLGDLPPSLERFLRFAGTVSLPADLTERRFRALWTQTDKNTREEELRFRQVVKLLCPEHVASPPIAVDPAQVRDTLDDNQLVALWHGREASPGVAR